MAQRRPPVAPVPPPRDTRGCGTGTLHGCCCSGGTRREPAGLPGRGFRGKPRRPPDTPVKLWVKEDLPTRFVRQQHLLTKSLT